MDLSKYASGDYLKAEDIKSKDTWAVVGAEEVELDGQKKAQLNLEHKGDKKSLTLNSTNIKRLSEVFGTFDSDRIVGRPLVFKIVETEYKGKRADGIRVDVEATKKLQPASDAQKQA